MTIDNSIGFYPSKNQIAAAWTWTIAETLPPDTVVYSPVFSVAALSNPATPFLPGNSWAIGYVFSYLYMYEDLPSASVGVWLDGRMPFGTGLWRLVDWLTDPSWPADANFPEAKPFQMRRLASIPEYRIGVWNGNLVETRWVEGAFSVLPR